VVAGKARLYTAKYSEQPTRRSGRREFCKRLESLEKAELLERHEENLRVLDVSQDVEQPEEKSDRLRKLGAAVSVKVGDSCFVMQPFAPPLGEYYDSVQ
jgi:hypothetical protein